MQPLPPRVCTGTALSVLNQEPFFTPTMTFYYFFIFHNSYLTTTHVNYIQAQKRQTQVKTLERREQRPKTL